MDWIRDKLSAIGLLIALSGVISSALYLFDYNLRSLMWVDMWGPLVGWGIRIGCIVGGLVLAFFATILGGGDSDHDHGSSTGG